MKPLKVIDSLMDRCSCGERWLKEKKDSGEARGLTMVIGTAAGAQASIKAKDGWPVLVLQSCSQHKPAARTQTAHPG